MMIQFMPFEYGKASWSEDGSIITGTLPVGAALGLTLVKAEILEGRS